MFLSTRRWSSISTVSLSLGLLVTTLIVKILGTYWIQQRFGHLVKEYSYVGSDYPEVWSIQRPPKVLMAFDNPKRFRIDTADGKAEWESLVPNGSAVVHLGPYKQPFTVSMFHELRCLDIIREEILRDHTVSGPTELGRHCLNYVRQMVTCRGDLHLESFQYASHRDPIDLRGIYECKDFEALYREVKKNRAEDLRKPRKEPDSDNQLA